MVSKHDVGQKLWEWLRRYLPSEIAGTVGELGAAAAAYLITHSLVAAAVAATIGASLGYYGAAYVAAVRITYAERADQRSVRRMVGANALAARSVLIEFGPAEAIDSLLIRPLGYYLGPILFDNTVAGWIFGKVVADIGFYLLAICSYERFKTLLAVRRPAAEAVNDEPVTTGAVA